MEAILFEKLLLKTAFCCIACDGDLDKSEIELLKLLFENKPLYANNNFDDKLNSFIKIYNEKGKSFFTFYFEVLKSSDLSEKEELEIIDMAIKAIKADNIIKYSEIKFFKAMRSYLKIEDENILAVYPEIEQFLEKDIITESYLEKVTNQYLDIAELPKFSLISSFESGSLDDLNKDI